MKRIIIFSIAVYLILLNTFYNSFIDETDWIQAGHSFKNALLSLNLKDTYVGYMSLHPGVTVLWISSTIQLISPNLSYSQLVTIHRLVFLIISFILLFVSAGFLLKDFDKGALVVMFFYFLLDPHSIISGNLSWLDLLVTLLILLCLLTWIRFLNFRNKADILKTGILVGLAILTKFMGIYLYLMLLAVTVFYSKVNRVSLRKFAKPLLGVFCLSLVTFIILYPAIWTDPKRVLFSRFNKQEAGHEITAAQSGSIIQAFPQKLADINPIILLGIPLVIVGLYPTKKSVSTLSILGLGGLIYFLCLITTLLIIFDKGRGLYIFLSALNRYLLPSIPLIGLFFFNKLLTNKAINQFLKVGLVASLFVWEISRLFYP